MKRTLLILAALISLNCLGQDTIYYNDYIAIDIPDSELLGLKIGSWDIESNAYERTDLNRMVILTLLNEYQKYSEECYNDSTIYGAQYYPCPDEVLERLAEDNDTRLYDCFKNTYYHKQPTFEGFMEWLNTKYK